MLHSLTRIGSLDRSNWTFHIHFGYVIRVTTTPTVKPDLACKPVQLYVASNFKHVLADHIILRFVLVLVLLFAAPALRKLANTFRLSEIVNSALVLLG